MQRLPWLSETKKHLKTYYDLQRLCMICLLHLQGKCKKKRGKKALRFIFKFSDSFAYILEVLRARTLYSTHIYIQPQVLCCILTNASFCGGKAGFWSNLTKVRVAEGAGEIHLPPPNHILTCLTVKSPPKAVDEGTSSL